MKIKLVDNLKTVMSNNESMHKYFGWPTVARLKNGRIAVGASGFRLAHVCPFGKSVISYSEDEGETFTSPAPVIDTALDDRDAGLCPFGESGLIFTSFNNTVAFQRKYNQGNPDLLKKAYIEAYLDTVSKQDEEKALGRTLRISRDNGITFGPVLKAPITSPHGPIELSDGSILWVGTAYETGSNEIVAYKLDPESGDTEYLGGIDTSGIKASGRSPSEPYAIELSDGTVLCHVRADGNDAFTLYQTESKDGGRTWSVPHQILSDRGGAPSHLLKHSSGALIAAYSYRLSPYGIKIMLSYDGGKAWSEGEYLYSNEISHDIGYPSTVELSDGSLLTVFYAKLEDDGDSVVHDGGSAVLAQRWRFEE